MDDPDPMDDPDRVTEDTQQAIADDLGVSEYLVSKAKSELENSGKQFESKSVNTDEKREQVREPGNREVYSHYWVQYSEYPIRTRSEA